MLQKNCFHSRHEAQVATDDLSLGFILEKPQQGNINELIYTRHIIVFKNHFARLRTVK